MAPRRLTDGMRLLLWGVLAVLLAACASIGRPDGGERDETPPRYVRSDPRPGATGVSPQRLTIFFDENIQLEDAFNKVVVSPAQKTPPTVTANGRRLTVDMRDTLLPNTTYTIDFADAIKDLNEGNILDGFAMDFSTGDTIDTLRISGMVIQAENLEPAQGMLVGVYSNLSDTAISTLPFERIARTNQLGHFTIRNLKPGKYRIFAVNDLNRDYHWDRSEDIAFYDGIIEPYAEAITVTDTLYSRAGEDSLVSRAGTRYMPNDILLAWFNINYKAQYLADYKREDRRRISIKLGAPSDTLPRITIADGAPGIGRSIEEWARLKANATGDTLEWWIADPEVVAADSLRLAVSYQRPDSTEQLVWTTDTLRFFFRDMEKKKKKKKDKDKEEADTVPPELEYVGVRALSSSMQELNKPLVFEIAQPLVSLDTAGVHLEMKVDTLWNAVGGLKILTDSSDVLLRHRLDVPWQAGESYRLTIDSLAATTIYGVWNKPFIHEFKVKTPEDYSTVIFTMPGTDSIRTVVELLSSSDAPVYRAVKEAGTPVVRIPFVNPGTYYARMFVDTTPNGKWDTGSIADNRQPEDVYYFGKKLELKKNWDVEQTWIIDELPVDAQKPYAIKKNKPKLKRGEKRPDEEDEEEEDDFYDPFGGRGGSSGTGRGGATSGRGGLRPAGDPGRIR